jgi:xylulokinase
MAAHLLGIDVSTTGSTAILIDETGAVVARASHEHPLSTPRPLWSEQNPEDWWSATTRSIRRVVEQSGKTPDAVGLTGQMHGLVMLDQAGAVLRPSILWNDQRTEAECAEITERVGLKTLLEKTGNPVLPGFTAPKIVWVRKHEPEVFAKAAKVLLPKDYARYRLTGGFFTDVSDASGMSLLDVGRRAWSEEILGALQIPRAWLAEVTESPVASSRVTAKGTGLKEGTPVVAGAGDQAAQAVGSGIVEEGLVSATLGTSGVVFAASDRYRVDPEGRLHAFCHAVPGRWHLMGVMLSAAGSFRWYRDVLGDGAGYDDLTALAAKAPAGCEGLLFLPYLTGERTPHPDPQAKGVFFGLTLRHGREHLTRAVLEGVSYGLRDSLELMRALGVKPSQVRASGGGARSALWRQILADVFRTEIATVNVTEGAAYGAAILAGVGVKVFPDVVSAARRLLKVTGSTKPGAEAGAYDGPYARYRALYPALKAEFRRA